MTPSSRRRPRHLALALLVLPFIGLLVPSWYARAEPRLAGIPFFIWYQFAWIIAGTVITVVVHRLVGEPGEDQA